MLFSRNTKRNRKRQSAWLYSIVFNGALSTCVIVVLFASFLVQPIHKVMAMEAVPEAVPPPDPVASDVAVQEDVPVSQDEPVVPDEVTVSNEIPEETILPDEPNTPSEDPSAAPDTESSTSTPDTTGDTSEVVETPTDTEGTTSDVVPTDEVPGPEEEPVAVPQSQENQNGTTTQVVQVEGLVNEDNFYQFSKQSCIEVGNGTYHCSKNTEVDADSQSVAYAEVDAEGDKEIFVKTSRGKIRQITDNGYDDTSPTYDPESMRVVWQRLIDGRYQIVLFDVMDEKEVQLTFSKTNNMEPKVSDAGIVWQAWDNHDWEIMLFDGTYTEQLTDNDTEDVAPVIQDGYVLWNVLGGEEQQARVYSLSTKETTPITGYEGGSIINPRFVLVYDTEYPNGDVVTQSFDPATGLSEPVAAKPAQEPVNIPESDPIGEIRALITSSKSKDEKQLLEVDTDGGNDTNNASSTNDGSLNLRSPDDVQQMFATTTVDMAPEFELTEYDLVIPQNALEEVLAETE